MRDHKDNDLRLLSDDKDCENCGSQINCLGGILAPEEQERLSGAIRRHTTFKPGNRIFKAEKKFKSLYAIKSGAVKLQSPSYDGSNVISGFYFSGDLVGIESIGDSIYRSDAIALTTTVVCEIPFHSLESLCDSIPALRREVMLLLAKKIRHTEQAIVNGRYLHAEVRLLLFFRYLCDHIGTHQRDGSKRLFLPMSKGDIASYLGLRRESLSRALKKLKKESVIRNTGKSIELLGTESATTLICGELNYRA